MFNPNAIWRKLLLAAFLVTLLVLTFLPVSTMHKFQMGIGLGTYTHADKAGHYIAYLILAILINRLAHPIHRTTLGCTLRIVLGVSLLSLILETLQAITWRPPFDWLDVAASTAGAITFGIAYRIWRHYAPEPLLNQVEYDYPITPRMKHRSKTSNK